MLEVLAKPETSLEGTHDLVRLMGQTAGLYHKTFVDSFFDRLKDVVEAKMLGADE